MNQKTDVENKTTLARPVPVALSMNNSVSMLPGVFPIFYLLTCTVKLLSINILCGFQKYLHTVEP